MPDADEQFDDDRLRAALGDLGEHARSTLHPSGADRIPAVARRRRYTAISGGTALLLAITGGFWLTLDPPGQQPAASVCTPAEARAVLRSDATAEQTEQLRAAIDHSPEISTYRFESREEAYERFKVAFADAPELIAATFPESLPASFWLDLPCATDFPAVRARLAPLASDVICPCVPDPEEAKKTVLPGESPSTWESPR
ncbi:permease-like cell division protein FtsX [Dactylosporangium sp. NPDC051541]|uniref:permease-like cell division protein FtsX n=1 Tax=Dactylosporangium sp. NPDC051541 TaxID=3363977 RepID=UPI0037AA85D6